MRAKRYPFSLLALALAMSLSLAAALPGIAQESGNSAVNVVNDAERLSVSLAIYNQGRALVQDRRLFSLNEGMNLINFTDVAASMLPTTVTFNSLTDPLNTFVLEQNYVFDLVNSSALLQRYIDQTITVVTDDGTTFTGELLSGRSEIILRDSEGEVLVIVPDSIRDIRFPDLPGGLITRPTLRWLLQSGAAGNQELQLTYLTTGMTWAADYNILLGQDESSLDINGWVTLTNTSGTSYADALVKLIAGDVNVNPVDQAVMREADMMYAAAAPVPTQTTQRDISEYKLYEITRPVTVADNETKQVEFVNGTDVPALTFYVYNGSTPYWGGGPIVDQYYGVTGVTDVQTYLEFTTAEENGLGADLPAGSIRVYQEDIDGAAVLIGENRIDHTPEGETVQIYMGNAFDLVGERTQTDFRYVGSEVLEETYEIRLRNRKDDVPVEIRVPETLFRWTNWEILSSSMEYTRVDSNTIEFRAMVPPDGETVITYTVRYMFPR